MLTHLSYFSQEQPRFCLVNRSFFSHLFWTMVLILWSLWLAEAYLRLTEQCRACIETCIFFLYIYIFFGQILSSFQRAIWIAINKGSRIHIWGLKPPKQVHASSILTIFIPNILTFTRRACNESHIHVELKRVSRIATKSNKHIQSKPTYHT